MSLLEGKLVSVILREYLGEQYEKIGNCMMKNGAVTLHFIAGRINIPVEKVKKALRLFIRHGFVTFQPAASKNQASYRLKSKKVLMVLRYCRYVECIKKRYGADVETVFEELLRRGVSQASNIVINAARRKQCEDIGSELPLLRDALNTLIKNRYIMRYPSPTGTESVPILKVHENELYCPLELDINELITVYNSDKNVVVSDENIYWRINFDRCHQEIRDEYLITAIKERFDDNSAELMKIILKLMYNCTEPWADISNPIPAIQLKDIIRKQNSKPQLLQFLDQYLNIMVEDQNRFINKLGDSSGGQYQVNMKEAITQLTWVTIENIVLEKYGNNAARIFRLVRAQKRIESDRIQPLVLIPIKEANHLAYRLLEDNFLQMTELRQSHSLGPQKSFFLFYIDIDEVVRMVLNMTYKSIYNIETRSRFYTSENKAIIDKKQRSVAVELDLRSKGVEEDDINEILGEIITPAEKGVLNKIMHTNTKLNTAAIQLDETLFLLELFLQYNQNK